MDEDLLYALKLGNLMVRSGTPSSHGESFIEILQENFPSGKEHLTLEQCYRLTEKASCNYVGLVCCVYCEKCTSWLLTRKVFCPNCRKQNHLTRLFGGCSEDGCLANNTHYEKEKETLTVENVGNKQCLHIRSTPVCAGYMVTAFDAMMGDIVKTGQMDLLTCSTREDMMHSLDICEKEKMLIPLVSLNGISTLLAMGEKEVATRIRGILEKAPFPEEVRNPLESVTQTLKEGKLLKHLPSAGEN